jgi:hypothetical protein
VRVRIDPVDGRPGRARLSLWVCDPETGRHSVLWHEPEDVPLDPHHPWTRAVAMHLSSISGGQLKAGHVLDVVRAAQQAELAAGWRR